jgi:hypothetical protein
MLRALLGRADFGSGPGFLQETGPLLFLFFISILFSLQFKFSLN